MWAAMAIYDGGGTTERQLRAACESLGVAYWRPDFNTLTSEHGCGFYEALSWLTGSSDGWEGGRRCPLELPARLPDGTPADDRSLELVGLIEDTRRRAAAALRS